MKLGMEAATLRQAGLSVVYKAIELYDVFFIFLFFSKSYIMLFSCLLASIWYIVY
jgi:hypothetical protein